MRMRREPVVRMGVPGRRLLRCEYVHFGSGKPAAAHLAHLQARAHAQRGGRLFKMSKIHAGIHQGAQQHVAAYAGETLQISDSHRLVILNCQLGSAPHQHVGGQDGIH